MCEWDDSLSSVLQVIIPMYDSHMESDHYINKTGPHITHNKPFIKKYVIHKQIISFLSFK